MDGFDVVEKVGLSDESYSEAVQNAIDSISKVRKVFWFEVIEQRGRVIDNKKIEYQIVVKAGVV